MKKTLLLILITTCSTASAAEKSVKPAANPAQVQVKRNSHGGYDLIRESVEFQILDWKQGSADAEMLEVKSIWRHLPAGYEKEIEKNQELARLRVSEGKAARELWRTRSGADKYWIHRDHNVWVTRLDGCCGAANAWQLLSLDSGAMLMPYTVPGGEMPYRVVGEFGTRFLGVHDAYWPSRDAPNYIPEKGDKWQIFAILTIADHAKTLQQVAVYRKPWNDPSGDPERFELQNAKGKVLLKNADARFAAIPRGGDKGLAVLLQWEKGKEIRIPFHKGLVAVKKAGLPKEYKLLDLPASEFHQPLKLITPVRRQAVGK